MIDAKMRQACLLKKLKFLPILEWVTLALLDEDCTAVFDTDRRLWRGFQAIFIMPESPPTFPSL